MILPSYALIGLQTTARSCQPYIGSYPLMSPWRALTASRLALLSCVLSLPLHTYRGMVWRQGDDPERVLYAADQVRSGTRSHDSESRRWGAHEDIWGRETHSIL